MIKKQILFDTDVNSEMFLPNLFEIVLNGILLEIRKSFNLILKDKFNELAINMFSFSLKSFPEKNFYFHFSVKFFQKFSSYVDSIGLPNGFVFEKFLDQFHYGLIDFFEKNIKLDGTPSSEKLNNNLSDQVQIKSAISNFLSSLNLFYRDKLLIYSKQNLSFPVKECKDSVLSLVQVFLKPPHEIKINFIQSCLTSLIGHSVKYDKISLTKNNETYFVNNVTISCVKYNLIAILTKNIS